MLPLEPLRAVRAASMTSPRTEDTGTCTPPDVVASGWSRQTPSACRNAGRIQQVHGGEGQACSGPLDGGNAAPPMSVSTKTFVFIAGRYAALRALHRSMLKRVSLVAAPRREVHVYGFGDGTRSPGGVGRSAIKGMPVPRYGSWGDVPSPRNPLGCAESLANTFKPKPADSKRRPRGRRYISVQCCLDGSPVFNEHACARVP